MWNFHADSLEILFYTETENCDMHMKTSQIQKYISTTTFSNLTEKLAFNIRMKIKSQEVFCSIQNTSIKISENFLPKVKKRDFKSIYILSWKSKCF